MAAAHLHLTSPSRQMIASVIRILVEEQRSSPNPSLEHKTSECANPISPPSLSNIFHFASTPVPHSVPHAVTSYLSFRAVYLQDDTPTRTVLTLLSDPELSTYRETSEKRLYPLQLSLLPTEIEFLTDCHIPATLGSIDSDLSPASRPSH